MNNKDYRLGMDIGTNSIGWAVIELQWNEFEQVYEKVGIIDKGVRMFDRAEGYKGVSLALPRRTARSTRNRLDRKSTRKKKIRQLLVLHGLITEKELNNLYPLKIGSQDIWELRLEGLDRVLSGVEWTRLLIHLSQRRGYKSNRKSDGNNKETGVVLQSIKSNQERLEKYRTIGEMLMKDEQFSQYDRKRNTTGFYLFSISRTQLEQEIHTLFEAQRTFGSSFASVELEEAYLQAWNHQLPFASGDDIINKVGSCSIYSNEKRIPKASYSFQYYSALDKLNGLRVGETLRTLTTEERQAAMEKLFNRTDYFKKKSVPEIKYSDLRKMIGLDEREKFKGITYDPNETLAKNEKGIFVNLKDYYTIHKYIMEHTESTDDKFSVQDYDQIAYALTIYKTDEDIKRFLVDGKNPLKKKYPNELVEQLLICSFTKFGHLSNKAIKAIVPKMEEGYTFREAVDKLGLELKSQENAKTKLLPPIPDDIPNPVVKRALSQSRKVVNEVIRKYNSPLSIHIELARELSKTYDERNKIQKEHNANYDKNKGAIKFLIESGIYQPTGFDITRFKLWEEQQGKCAYSLRDISPDDLIKELKKERSTGPILDVDHIIPYSLSYMDGYQNKVLVYSDENRKKGNRLPYEYLSTIPGRWERFVNFVETTYTNKKNRKKRELLLKQEISEAAILDLRDRHLNDTRYITRYFKNFIEDKLILKSGMDNRKKRVISVSGQITSFLRQRWGLRKERDSTFLHHAIDAVVAACTDDAMIKRITDHMKDKENNVKKFKTRFPLPWQGFRDDVLTIMSEQVIPAQLMKKVEINNRERDYLLVSRVPRYSVTGEAHEMTVRKKAGIDKNGKILTVKRVHLRDIKFDKNGDFDMVGKDTDQATYLAIKNHYLAHNGDVKTAFAEENLPLKPSKDPFKANKIKKITINDSSNSYVREINGGVVGNGSLVRVDIFIREDKYIMVPIYVADTTLSELPNKYVKSSKGYEQWPQLDEQCYFQFSLHPYDVLYIENRGVPNILHFVSIDISGNKIECKLINSPSDKRDYRFTLNKVDKLVKLKSTVLGDVQIVKKETRQTFRK